MPEREHPDDFEVSPTLTRSATEDTGSEETDESTSLKPAPQKLPISGQTQKEIFDARQASSHPDIPRAISPENLNYSQSVSAADMKSAFKRMRSRLNPSQQILPSTPPLKPSRPYSIIGTSPETNDIRSSTSFSIHAYDESRKRSGSFGSRMLRRAKSAVGKQPKKELHVNKKEQNEVRVDSHRHEIKKQRSLNENLVYRVSSSTNDYSIMKQNTIDGSFFEDGHMFHSAENIDSETFSPALSLIHI